MRRGSVALFRALGLKEGLAAVSIAMERQII
jgi:hypothetical protein